LVGSSIFIGDESAAAGIRLGLGDVLLVAGSLVALIWFWTVEVSLLPTVCSMAARSSATGPSAEYVRSMPKVRPATPAPQTEKSEEFAHLAEGTLVSAPKKERVEARSRERARERSVSDD